MVPAVLAGKKIEWFSSNDYCENCMGPTDNYDF